MIPAHIIEEWARAAFERHARVSGEHGRWDDLEDCPEVRQGWIEAVRLVVEFRERFDGKSSQ